MQCRNTVYRSVSMVEISLLAAINFATELVQRLPNYVGGTRARDYGQIGHELA